VILVYLLGVATGAGMVFVGLAVVMRRVR